MQIESKVLSNNEVFQLFCHLLLLISKRVMFDWHAPLHVKMLHHSLKFSTEGEVEYRMCFSHSFQCCVEIFLKLFTVVISHKKTDNLVLKMQKHSLQKSLLLHCILIHFLLDARNFY